MSVLGDVPWLFRSAIRRLGQTSTIAIVVTLLIGTVLVGSALVSAMEFIGAAGGPSNYFASVWWFGNTITGLGLPATKPATQAGQAVSAGTLLLSRIFFGMFIGAVASFMVNSLLMEGKGMGSVKLQNHVVVCGWNVRGGQVVEMLRHDERRQGIVILAGLDSAPSHANGVHFVHGDSSMENDLSRAGIETAETVIILADETVTDGKDSTKDGRSVLIALTVHSMNPKAYMIAEVRQAENRRHFLYAGVNEVLVANDLTADLMARSAVHHGLTRIVSDLLTVGGDSEVYIVPPPAGMVGRSFDEILIDLRTMYGMILVGMCRNGESVINPAEHEVVGENDRLVVVAHGDPVRTWSSAGRKINRVAEPA